MIAREPQPVDEFEGAKFIEIDLTSTGVLVVHSVRYVRTGATVSRWDDYTLETAKSGALVSQERSRRARCEQ